MFFKKKKPEPSSEVEHQAIVPAASSSEKSIFAPGLNPQAAPIDFGLGNTDQHSQQPYSMQTPAGSYDPWASSPENEWKPPTAGTADWMTADYTTVTGVPASDSGLASPVDAGWQPPPLGNDLTIPPAPMPQSPGDLTPEQSWSMMEPTLSSAQAPAEPMTDYSNMDFAGGFSAESPAQGLGALPTGPQDDWMKAFEEPNTQFSEFSPAPVAPSTDFVSSDLPSSPPLSSLEESWTSSFQPESGYTPENAPIGSRETMLPPMSTDFENHLTNEWTIPQASTQPQDLTSRSWESGLAPGNPGQAYTTDLSLSDAGFASSTEDAQFLGSPPMPTSPEGEPLWEASLPETGMDLQSQFNSSESAQPTLNISEPNLGTADLSPDLAPLAFSEQSPSTVPLTQTEGSFDPLAGSQTLETDWSQFGPMSQSLEDAEAWQSGTVSNLPSASWSDEQVPADTEWVPPAVGNASDPVYFHEIPAESESETQLWDNLNSSDFSPGEQVPYVSGAMMDSINEQLYPDDPFTVQGEFAAGEQAFADAARYLFPETVNAPLDWADSGYSPEEEAESDFYGEGSATPPILELGPSYSAPNEGFAELPAGQPTTYTEIEGLKHYEAPPQPEAFVGFPETQQTSAPISGLSHDTTSAFNAADEQWLGVSSEDEPVWSLGEDSESNFYQPAAPQGGSQIGTEEISPTMWSPQSGQSFETIAPMEAAIASANMDNAWQSPVMEQPMGQPSVADYDNSTYAQAGSMLQEPHMPLQLEEEDDSDFYATAFTLNEQGELVPVHENEMMQDFEVLNRPSIPVTAPLPQALQQPQTQGYDAIDPQHSVHQAPPMEQFAQPQEMPLKPQMAPEQFLAAARNRMSAEATRSVMHTDQALAPGPLPQNQNPAGLQSRMASPLAPPEPVVEEARIRPKPLNRKMPEPVTSPESSSLESQWYNPQEPALDLAPPPSTSDMAMKLTLGNLEVIGICQLSVEKRLLIVHHDGVYALMGQSGQEKTDVNVLKVFEHNPLAYQHTFTAVEEGNAAGQGMYVTQIGTWHAIISTFQDKITLHTELG